MIDTSKAKWDLSKEEKYAVKWLDKHGFSGSLKKQYISKTKFTICKDGINIPFEVFIDAKGYSVKKAMELLEKSFELELQNQELKRQIELAKAEIAMQSSEGKDDANGETAAGMSRKL